jgi:hypothetical protein
MVYALVITVAAGLLLLALPAGLFWFGRRATQGNLSFRGWRWHPNRIGFSVLAIVAAVVFARFFPGILFLLFVIPVLWRFRGRRSGGGRPFVWQWRAKRGQPHTNGQSNGHKQGDDPAIEGQYRNLDDE